MHKIDGIYYWNYTPSEEKEDAYNSIIDKLNIITPDKFKQLSTDEQNVYSEKFASSVTSVRTALKNNSIYNNYFYRYYPVGIEPPEIIDIDYICEIDGQHFFKQEDMAKYLSVTRQAISGAKSRHAKTIDGKEIKWKI